MQIRSWLLLHLLAADTLWASYCIRLLYLAPVLISDGYQISWSSKRTPAPVTTTTTSTSWPRWNVANGTAAGGTTLASRGLAVRTKCAATPNAFCVAVTSGCKTAAVFHVSGESRPPGLQLPHQRGVAPFWEVIKRETWKIVSRIFQFSLILNCNCCLTL